MCYTMWNGRVYVLKCVLWYGSGKHNAVQLYIWMLPGIVRQARTNLGVPYMHVRWVYMLCAVLPCLVSWVFVECCSRETPDLQVGAGNISYHSQYQNKQASIHVIRLYYTDIDYTDIHWLLVLGLVSQGHQSRFPWRRAVKMILNNPGQLTECRVGVRGLLV